MNHLLNGDFDLARQELDRLGTDAEFRREFAEKHTVTWADIPLLECHAIESIIKKYLDLDDFTKFEELFLRLNLINEKFNDPRIRFSYGSILIQYGKFDSGVKDAMIQKTYLLIKKTPPQVRPIDVSYEKYRYVDMLTAYYINEMGDFDKSRHFFSDFAIHILGLPAHSMHLNAIIGLCQTACNICYNLFLQRELEESEWYYNQAVSIASYLEPQVPLNASHAVWQMARNMAEKIYEDALKPSQKPSSATKNTKTATPPAARPAF